MAEDSATADLTKGTEPQNSISVRFLERLKRAVWNMSLLFIWVGMIVLFGLLEPDAFLSMVTLRSVLADQAITAMMAMSLIMPIASNKFDLSVAGMMGLSAILVATFIVKVGMPWPPCNPADSPLWIGRRRAQCFRGRRSEDQLLHRDPRDPLNPRGDDSMD